MIKVFIITPIFLIVVLICIFPNPVGKSVKITCEVFANSLANSTKYGGGVSYGIIEQ
jgi:hypothetical protein